MTLNSLVPYINLPKSASLSTPPTRTREDFFRFGTIFRLINWDEEPLQDDHRLTGICGVSFDGPIYQKRRWFIVVEGNDKHVCVVEVATYGRIKDSAGSSSHVSVNAESSVMLSSWAPRWSTRRDMLSTAIRVIPRNESVEACLTPGGDFVIDFSHIYTLDRSQEVQAFGQVASRSVGLLREYYERQSS